MNKANLEKCCVDGNGDLINLGNQTQTGRPLDFQINNSQYSDFDNRERLSPSNLPYGLYRREENINERRHFHNRERPAGRDSNLPYGRYPQEENVNERSHFHNRE